MVKSGEKLGKRVLPEIKGNGTPVQKGVTIAAPNFKTVAILIRGTSSYVQNKFSAKARQQMHDTQAAGSTAANKKNRKAKDFKKCFEEAQYKMADGTNGIPAAAFRNSMIAACRLVNYHMTMAKQTIFVLADGVDPDDHRDLVKFTKGKPVYFEDTARNDNGSVDLRARPLWEAGWEMTLRIRFDADQFTEQDVANLLMRAGQQVGVGEGRPASKDSCGCGWGTFEVVAK